MDDSVRYPLTANPDEIDVLVALSRMLDDEHAQPLRLIGCDQQAIVLTPALSTVLREAAHALQRGDAVSIVPIYKQLTTQEAADLLGVSRPYLIQLLERGELPYAMTGSHRRIAFQAVLEYGRRHDAERRNALRELTQLSQALGMYSSVETE